MQAARQTGASPKVLEPAAPSLYPPAHQARRSPHTRQLTQHLHPGLGLNAASWGAAHAAVPRPIVHLHAVDAQGPVLGDLKSRVLQHKSWPEPPPTPPEDSLRERTMWRGAPRSGGRAFHPNPAASPALTSEMSIWFLYQMTVGFGVA